MQHIIEEQHDRSNGYSQTPGQAWQGKKNGGKKKGKKAKAGKRGKKESAEKKRERIEKERKQVEKEEQRQKEKAVKDVQNKGKKALHWTSLHAHMHRAV